MFVAVKTKPSPRQGKGDHEVVDEDAIFKGLHTHKHQFTVQILIYRSDELCRGDHRSSAVAKSQEQHLRTVEVAKRREGLE